MASPAFHQGRARMERASLTLVVSYVARVTEPADIQRLRVIIVMSLGFCFPALLTWLTDELPAFHCVVGLRTRPYLLGMPGFSTQPILTVLLRGNRAGAGLCFAHVRIVAQVATDRNRKDAQLATFFQAKKNPLKAGYSFNYARFAGKAASIMAFMREISSGDRSRSSRDSQSTSGSVKISTGS
jgi:hypothetical protein